MTREDFAFVENYLREKWAQEGEKNEVDIERSIELLVRIFEVEDDDT